VVLQAKLKQVKEDRAEESGKGRLQRKRNMFQTMPINLKANFQRHLHRGHKYGVIAEAEPDNYQDKQIPLVHFIAVRAIEKVRPIECSLNAPSMFTGCSLNVHWTFSECSLNVHWMFPKCSLNVH
jgi:hypothetical protein